VARETSLRRPAKPSLRIGKQYGRKCDAQNFPVGSPVPVEIDGHVMHGSESPPHAVPRISEHERIWNVSQDLLIVADANGRFLSINPAWTATLGWSEGDLLGNTFVWLCHPNDLAATQKGLARLADGQKTAPFDNRFRHKNGSYCWLSWRAVTDKGRVYAVARDVTDLRNAEERLRASHHELAQVSRQMTVGAMTASIAHEVNQPLAAIVTNAHAGLRWLSGASPDLDEVRLVLERIVSDGHRASEVIASIRSMFGKDRRETSPVHLNDLVVEVLALVKMELETHQITLEIEMHDGLPAVMAERVQLQQVFLNLIKNAVDAMSSITDHNRVLAIKSEGCESNNVLMTVEDSGTGIDPEHADHIFDAFFTTKTHGMGMGLSICRSIIELHGGKLWASARSPCGSRFCVKLPSIVPE
jgi:PAS domain S-box-containing protein